jgi:transketolase
MTATLPDAELAPADTRELQRIALRVREHVLAIGASPVGTHVGSSLSVTDILVALYFGVLRVRPEEPKWADRDYFVLSKGHASAAMYATLAERGFIPVSELATYGTGEGRLFAHPTPCIPGVEFATGSLGHGLSLAIGLALAARRFGRPSRVFVVMGDGELQEGSVWEAAMAASHFGLGNLTAVIDRNGLQINGSTERGMRLEPLSERWRSFGWQVTDVDGHDMGQLLGALRGAPADPGQPAMVLASTVKGRGVGFLENRKHSHYAVMSRDIHARALKALHASAAAAGIDVVAADAAREPGRP